MKTNEVRFYHWLVILFCLPFSLSAQESCIEGLAGDYACDNVDLLARLTTTDLLAEQQSGIWINDIWGWTDPASNKEYVIIGMANGTSFVDISDPVNPIVLGILPEHHTATAGRINDEDGAKSIWRDIKVYNNYAFMVSEDTDHGMQVFDLTDLRNVMNPPEEFTEAGHYGGVSNAHNIAINEETGYAYAVGSTKGGGTCSAGGLHIINIQDPLNPTYEACFDNDGYTHDAQCVIYQGPDTDHFGKEICFNANEKSITIVDVDDKANIQMISRSVYTGSSYAHQGWLTEDHKYYLSNDETDELNNGTNTTTFIWDVSDLDAPVLIGQYVHETVAIDHNLYIVGNSVYESNYTSGLRILDISDIANANLKQIAFFDTYPNNDDPEFYGTWSNYPFFESGVVAVSDITNGLFLLMPHYGAFISQHPGDIAGCVDEQYNMTIEVVGANIIYNWQIDTGGGFEDITDFVLYKNTTTNSLLLDGVSIAQDQFLYRCEITAATGEIFYSNSAALSITENAIASFDMASIANRILFTNTSYAAETYAWDFGDGSTINTSESPQHQYAYSTTPYTVVLTVANSCSSDISTTNVNVILSVFDENQLNSALRLYPVPANNRITIDASPIFQLHDYTVYTTNGKPVLNGNLSKGRNTIDVSQLGYGVYILEVQTAKGEAVRQRIIIQ